MNETNQIKRIRTLLDSYYGGSASREQTAELANLFSAVDPLPEDLNQEKKVFLMIENPLLSSEQEIAVPDYLGERISNEIMTRNRRFKFRRLITVTASAAVLAFALTMGWKAIDIASNNNLQQINSSSNFASVSSPGGENSDLNDSYLLALPKEGEVDYSTPENSTGKEELSLSKGKANKNIIKKHSSHLASAEISRKEKAKFISNKREITDPEEAAAIVDQVLVMMNQNIFTAEMACEEPEMILESINRKITGVNL